MTNATGRPCDFQLWGHGGDSRCIRCGRMRSEVSITQLADPCPNRGLARLPTEVPRIEQAVTAALKIWSSTEGHSDVREALEYAQEEYRRLERAAEDLGVTAVDITEKARAIKAGHDAAIEASIKAFLAHGVALEDLELVVSTPPLGPTTARVRIRS